MATIYEVAKLAGVSAATVSRYFNGINVSAKRAEAVRAAAAQLQFRPNRVARTLRRQKSEVIALVLPDIENPYFTELARGVEDVAQRAGYSVVMCNTDSNLAKEAQYFQIAISENMAGLIVAAASDRTDFGAIIAAERPVVAVDRASSFDLDEVVMANRDAGRAAANALIESGYKRIACITGPENIETAADRADGWKTAVTGTDGIEYSPDLLKFADFRVSGGRNATIKLLASSTPPDAIVAGNNLLGVGTLQVLTERGLTPPKVGVAVVGSLPFTTLSPSIVTVVRLPARQMGVTAATILMDRISGDKQPARTVVLRGQVQAAATQEPPEARSPSHV